VLVALLLPSSAPAQVVVGPGESTETAFRREIRGSWFAWLAAHDEGDLVLGRARLEEIVKHSRKIGIARLTDLGLAATLSAKKEMAAGRWDRARDSVDSAILLDPDLPEARWADLAVRAGTGRWSAMPRALVVAIDMSLTDVETRRVLLWRLFLLWALAAAAVGVSVLLLAVVSHAPCLFHDLAELASRVQAGPASTVLAAGLLCLPLILTFDPFWWLLALAIASFGYAQRGERYVVAASFLLLLPLGPVLDGVGEEIGASASPIVRAAEALEESRYDQRVLDDLEAVQNVVAGDADISFLLGRLYQALGQNDRAVAQYSRAASASPKETRALVNRGNIRFVDGDFGSAQEDFQEALRRDPACVEARYNISLVYAETFRTIDATRALHEARALDARLVQRLQDRPSLVKVASVDFTRAEALRKVEAMEREGKSRRLLGHFRSGQGSRAWRTPVFWALVVAPAAAFGIDRVRRRRRGYASECQKCGRTFCRRCKPAGENVVLCSQCVHVYMKKDGVSIETKMQKVDEVRKRRAFLGRARLALNLLLPGTTPFLSGHPGRAMLTLTLFFVGLLGAFWWGALIVDARPGVDPPFVVSHALPLLVALGGWGLAQVPAARS